MREATKPIMITTAAAFVALMVFEWGMDISGRSSGGVGEIGSVNGEPVTYEAYMTAYRNLYDQVQRSRDEPLTSQQNKELEDAAFDEVVNQILIRQELKRRGITVTDDEIREAAKYTPPPDLRPQFTDSLGRFDLQSYQALLAQLPQDQLLLLEAYYRDAIPRGKLLRQVSSGIYLSDGELWRQYRDQTESVEIQYIALDPGTRYADGDVTVERAEVEAHYRSHQDEFKVPARATVKAVVLSKAPTAADSAAALERARRVRQEILDGGDFAAIAARESADSVSAKAGGSLGTFRRGTLVFAFDSAVFAARVGSVAEPVRTPFGWHIFQVQQRWGTDSAQARQILIPIQRTDSSEVHLLTLADSLEEMARTRSLEDAAAALGLSTTTAEITSTFPFLAGAGSIGEGADWATEDAAPGDVSPVFETSEAFYALELISSAPAGVLPLAEVAPGIESQLRFRKKLEKAKEEGKQIAARIKAGEALSSVASALGVEIRTAGPFTRADFVPGLGRQNAAIGAAFSLQPGQVSDAVATSANVFVIQLLGRMPADSLAWEAQKEAQRREMISQLQEQRLREWIAALRKAAKIVDRREQVLQPRSDTASF